MVESADNDQEWILDIIAEYLQSPIWKTAIIDFIDENCIIFEDAEENRLEYTDVHLKFRKLIET